MLFYILSRGIGLNATSFFLKVLTIFLLVMLVSCSSDNSSEKKQVFNENTILKPDSNSSSNSENADLVASSSSTPLLDSSQNCNSDYTYNGNCYEEFFTGLDIDSTTRQLYLKNLERFIEICLNNWSQNELNPLSEIYRTGLYPIYFHIESWDGPVTLLAIQQLVQDYEFIANQWLNSLNDYDSSIPEHVKIQVFGFVFNEGVEIDESFYSQYENYPIVMNYTKTNEESPWKIIEKNSGALFNQNWYTHADFATLQVINNREDLSSQVTFSPQDWSSYSHPENIDIFWTKFWHKTTWDAVAQRQYLKIGGVITDYSLGNSIYSVFAHEMGHTFFLDDIYDRGKYPEAENIDSIMNGDATISDFDTLCLRIVWKKQRLILASMNM